MKAWRFLQYERPYLLLYAVAFLITIAVFAADPQSPWRWPTFFYVLALVALWLAAFLLHRYIRTLQAIRGLREEDSEPLSLEAEMYRDALEQQEREHIRALNEVQAKQREHYDFIVSWFHEVKTPIAVLRLMQQTEVDPMSLEEELSRIEHYVDQALYYAKLDSFHQDYEIVNVDLAMLAKDVVKAHSKTFISQKIRMQFDVQAMTVQSDTKWLHFILNQLITNSLKYTDDRGVISLSTRDTHLERRLVLRDNGIGVEPKDLPRIFNRGFTGSTGRKHMKSTGMGLYLAQELSKKLGHYITCESETGRYTEFIVHFPRNHDPYLHMLQRNDQPY